MYYYKHVINGETVSVESRNLRAVNAPDTMQEITLAEYTELMEQCAVQEEQPSVDERMSAVEEALDILLNGTTGEEADDDADV